MSAHRHLATAAEKLRTTLPGDLSATPRLVMTDSESVDGIAFCVEHLLPLDGEHTYSACDNYWVIECHHESLAELIHTLLLARAPLADWLHDWEGFEIREDGPMPDDLKAALSIARTVNGGAA
ncbi:hypothetical protein [Actinomadura rudentiformis]|uniref:Uncharacterized protein n=1 Tax=Actinomadura rudentiformis TaxID=359158 RepID=A0A6H9YJW3_9ACTN|nr:hypothetical protein [Actinomadura rudentiformis]KAB2347295.1 hypothetical protein F8566_19985 [Actinomadura rudentiformis]